VQLGQSSTLSGGEAQRIKPSFLVKGNTKKHYLFWWNNNRFAFS
jgi:excinuclease UvrABC ATPase subunit